MTEAELNKDDGPVLSEEQVRGWLHFRTLPVVLTHLPFAAPLCCHC
jgi:hypothetical protein